MISDGDGLAIIGDPAAVERFLESEGLPSKDLGIPRLRSVLGDAAAGAQAWSDIAANSGRWVKLTAESTERAKRWGLMKDKVSGLDMGVVHAKGVRGGIKGPLRFEKGPGSLLNPASLSGAAGVMAQLAMQQAIEEITEYLVTIDKKLDDMLRTQTNVVLARLDGVDFAIREAMKVRDAVGRVSEVTWSKVQATSTTIFEVQGLALRQLNDLADKLEREAGPRKAKVADLSTAIEEAKPEVRKWITVLARCFQLQEAVALLELDRVLDASPEQLDRHRLGMKAARQDRLELISTRTERILTRMIATADKANARVLLHPAASPALVQSSNHVTSDIYGLYETLGIESGAQQMEARRWMEAAAQVRDRAVEGAAGAGAGGIDAAKRAGNLSVDRAKTAKDKVSTEFAARARRLRRIDGGDRTVKHEEL